MPDKIEELPRNDHAVFSQSEYSRVMPLLDKNAPTSWTTGFFGIKYYFIMVVIFSLYGIFLRTLKTLCQRLCGRWIPDILIIVLIAFLFAALSSLLHKFIDT